MDLDYLPLFIDVGFSFSSDWFYHNVGTKYNQDIYENPELKLEMKQKEEEFVREKYPKLYNWNPTKKYKETPYLGIGVGTIPRIFGCEIVYQDHMNPFAKSLLKSNENPMSLKVPDLDDCMQWLFDEVDFYREAGYKTINLPDLQGPLNLSMKLVGDTRMLGLIARKNKASIVEHILEIASDTYIEVYQRLRKITNRPPKANWSVSGCTHYYISPNQWNRYILPIIKKCEVLGNGIRLHHCGEANAERIQAYAKYSWHSVELGFGSDLQLARQLFMHPKLGAIQISCRVSPYRLLNQSPAQITQDINMIIDNAKGGPMNISCVGIPWKTPENNIWAMYNAVDAYNKMKEAECDEDD